jgi:hypothetical protein
MNQSTNQTTPSPHRTASILVPAVTLHTISYSKVLSHSQFLAPVGIQRIHPHSHSLRDNPDSILKSFPTNTNCSIEPKLARTIFQRRIGPRTMLDPE